MITKTNDRFEDPLGYQPGMAKVARSGLWGLGVGLGAGLALGAVFLLLGLAFKLLDKLDVP